MRPAAKPKSAGRHGRVPPAASAPAQAPDSPRLLTVREIATAMSVQPGQVRRWIEDGCTVAVKGGPGKSALLDLEAVKAWRVPRNATISVAVESARLKAADRALKEQQLRLRSGQLLERGPWIRAAQEHVVHAKAKLLALPAALAERTCHAATAGGPGAVQRLWLDAIEEALRELAGVVPEVAPS